MKKIALLILAMAVMSNAQTTNGPKPSAEVSPVAILNTMKLVADWQLAHPSPTVNRNKENSWTYGAFYTGIMALDEIAGTPRYHDAMIAVGKEFDWTPASRTYHADDHCVAQMYLELYLKDRNPAMLAPTKERFGFILAHPSTNQLDQTGQNKMDRWWWCWRM